MKLRYSLLTAALFCGVYTAQAKATDNFAVLYQQQIAPLHLLLTFSGKMMRHIDRKNWHELPFYSSTWAGCRQNYSQRLGEVPGLQHWEWGRKCHMLDQMTTYTAVQVFQSNFRMNTVYAMHKMPFVVHSLARWDIAPKLCKKQWQTNTIAWTPSLKVWNHYLYTERFGSQF